MQWYAKQRQTWSNYTKFIIERLLARILKKGNKPHQNIILIVNPTNQYLTQMRTSIKVLKHFKIA